MTYLTRDAGNQRYFAVAIRAGAFAGHFTNEFLLWGNTAHVYTPRAGKLQSTISPATTNVLCGDKLIACTHIQLT